MASLALAGLLLGLAVGFGSGIKIWPLKEDSSGQQRCPSGCGEAWGASPGGNVSRHSLAEGRRVRCLPGAPSHRFPRMNSG